MNLPLVSGIPKAKFYKEEGSYNIKTTVQSYEEASIDYQQRFAKTYSYSIGLHFTGSGRSAFFNAPVDKINSDYDPGYYSFMRANGFDIGLSVPLTLEKHWNVHQNESYFGQLGLQLHHSIIENFDDKDYFLQDTSGNYVNVFELSVNPNNERKFWFTYSFGCGYERMLRNGNLLRLGLAANLSFTQYAKGIYTITIPGEPQTLGKYHVYGSGFGVSVAYGLTRLNRSKTVRHFKNKP